MKLKVKQDNYGRVRKVRELSLNEKKKTQLRLSAHGHLQLWGTLQVLWIGLLMTMNGALHPWADGGRAVCDSRLERERGRGTEREGEAGCQWSGESGGTLVAALFEESRGQFR